MAYISYSISDLTSYNNQYNIVPSFCLINKNETFLLIPTLD